MPIARVATTAGGSQNVYIDGYTQSYSAAMACFLATIDDHGYLLTTKSFNTPANNGNTGRNWEVSLSLTGAEAPVWSYMALQCSLPSGVFLQGVAVSY
jgi:hypothetical protein